MTWLCVGGSGSARCHSDSAASLRTEWLAQQAPSIADDGGSGDGLREWFREAQARAGVTEVLVEGVCRVAMIAGCHGNANSASVACPILNRTGQSTTDSPRSRCFIDDKRSQPGDHRGCVNRVKQVAAHDATHTAIQFRDEGDRGRRGGKMLQPLNDG